MIIKGFRFGLLLQFSVGPVCLFIFQTAISGGFLKAIVGVCGIALADGLEIVLAICGIGTVIKKNKHAQLILKLFGTTILFTYGILSILSVFNIDLLPSITTGYNKNNIFISSIILTLSNPLTIIFWAGVFSAKIVEENMKGHDLYFFGLGCVLSTLIFLTVISFLGSVTQNYIPNVVIHILNIGIGCLLIYFGIKISKQSNQSE